MTTAEKRTVHRRNSTIQRDSYYGEFEVPETGSNYELLAFRHPDKPVVVISLVNWGTSYEYGVWPGEPGMMHSIAEHLTDGNLVDAENVVHVLACMARTWEV